MGLVLDTIPLQCLRTIKLSAISEPDWAFVKTLSPSRLTIEAELLGCIL